MRVTDTLAPLRDARCLVISESPWPPLPFSGKSSSTSAHWFHFRSGLIITISLSSAFQRRSTADLLEQYVHYSFRDLLVLARMSRIHLRMRASLIYNLTSSFPDQAKSTFLGCLPCNSASDCDALPHRHSSWSQSPITNKSSLPEHLSCERIRQI